jgi:hypothetical protein
LRKKARIRLLAHQRQAFQRLARQLVEVFWASRATEAFILKRPFDVIVRALDGAVLM